MPLIRQLLRFALPIPLLASIGWAAPTTQPGSAPPILDPSELRPGMKGYGLTVFSGTEPERFGAEVLGVVKNNWASGDMVVLRLDHPALTGAGVIQGMSGSPVYIEGALIGAVAYGWAFSLQPVCGVTPIREMLKVNATITKEPALVAEEWPGAPPTPGAVSVDPGVLSAMGLTTSGDGLFRPLAMPVSLSSASPAVLEQARTLFADSGFKPVAATAGGGTPDSAPPPPADLTAEPGSAIGIDFIRGDFQMAAIGTVTYLEPDRLVAFGHSMMSIGASDAPASLASIAVSIPSLSFPFKMGYTVKEIGALRQDRQFALGVTTEGRTRMLPVQFRVVNAVGKSDHTYHYEVMPERRMAAGLVSLCLAQSIAAASTLDGPMNLRVDYRIVLDNGRTLEQRHFVTGEGNVLFAGARRLETDVDELVSNRYEPVRVTSVSGTIKMDERHQVLTLDRVIREKTKVRRGDTVTGTVRFGQWRRPPKDVPFQIAIPKNLPAGQYELYLADGRSREQYERSLRPELSRVDSLADLIDQLEADFPENTLYVLLVDPSDRTVIQRQSLDSLPSSVRLVTEQTSRDPKQTYTSRGRLIAEQRIEFPTYLAGSTMLPIDVLDK